MSFSKNSFPQLVFSDKPLVEIVSEETKGRDAVIFTDAYHIERVSQFSNIEVTVVSPYEIDRISHMVREKSWKVLIGMGGCRAMDMARLLAKTTDDLTLIPTILSTPCISSAHSVIYGDGHSYSVKTVFPRKVIVPLNWIREDDQELQKYYFAAGAGDLMAEVSASIQKCWEEYLATEKLPHIDVTDFSILEFLASVKSLDNETVIKFSKKLHLNSQEDWESDVPECEIAGEHELYYQMFIQQKYSHNKPTHGALVSIGTLLSAWLMGKLTSKL